MAPNRRLFSFSKRTESRRRLHAPRARARLNLAPAKILLGLALALSTTLALGQDVPGYTIVDLPEVTIEHVSDASTAGRVAKLYADARGEVEARLGLPLPQRPHVVVAPNDAEFARRYALLAGEPPPSYVLAVAFPALNQVIIRRSGLREGTDSGLYRTFKHELAHLAIGPLERRRGKRLPRWLGEGLAEWAAGREPTSKEASALASWAKFGTMPALHTLSRSFPPHGDASARAYTVSMGFVNWIDARASARALVAELETNPDTDEAFVAALGMDVRDAELEWLTELMDDHSYLKNIIFSVNVWSLSGLLALVAFARHLFVTRRKKRELLEQELAEDGDAA